MEPLLGDVTAAAAALCVVPPGRRGWVLARMMREAVSADAHRARFRRAHPIWGDGSLMTAALRRHPLPEPGLDSADYCRCLAMTYQALGARGH